MYHTVYKTTNTINNKYYIGVHSTKNINDEYLGCGHWRGRKINLNTISPIIQAFRKYGDFNFKKEILFVLERREDALLKERELINKADSKCYNARDGGDEEYTYTIEAKSKMSQSAKIRSKRILLQTDILKEHVKNRIGKTYAEIYGEEKAKEITLKKSKSLTGRKLSDEHKRKMSINRKGKDCGKSKGRVQVWNNITKKGMKIPKDILQAGLKEGSIIEQLFVKDKFHKFKFSKIK
jgi:hypothetical protein